MSGLFLFCELAEELYMDEQQMQENDIRLKDEYKKRGTFDICGN